MNYYWSCWYTMDELKNFGATNIKLAEYHGIVLTPFHVDGALSTLQPLYENHFCFSANDELLTFIRLTKDYPIIKISNEIFDSISQNKYINIEFDQSITISNCIYYKT